MSTNYIAEGDYAEGEYYFLLLCSVLGMTVMASARDLITIFVALELLSIPAYMLAGWRKRDLMGNEAGVKYYLMGVFASAILLYGMSLLFGVAGDTRLSDDRRQAISGGAGNAPMITLAIVFTVVGFAFKVSAVPFHTWAPDTYEGAPTPDHRLPRRGVEGGRLRRPAPGDLHRLPRSHRRRRAAHVGARRRSP